MNKKILIGSIIAVAILVLVSFTGVVGYQTTKSSTIAKSSPLFTVRSSRAIGEESKDFTCDYVGKGNTFLIPKRDDKIVLVQRFIDIISKIDESSRTRLKDLIMNNPNQNTEIDKLNPSNPKTPPISQWYTTHPPTIDCYIVAILLWLISIPINICVYIIQFLIWLPYDIFNAIVWFIENFILILKQDLQ